MGAVVGLGRRLGRAATTALAAFLLLGVLPSTHGAVAATVDEEAVWASNATIDEFVAEQLDRMRLPTLAVVVIVDGETRYEGAHGGTAPGQDPATIDTAYALGSVSKQFTGLAIQRLIAEGQLTGETTVREVLEDLLPEGGGAFADATVTQLLGHHAGFSYGDGLRHLMLRQPDRALDEHTRMLLTLDPIVGSGDRFEYSNANYTVLGAMVEKLRDEPFPEAMDALVFAPLGMTQTTADAAADRTGGRYPWFGLANIAMPQPQRAASVPAAFMTSTAGDLARLLKAHTGAATEFPQAVLEAARALVTQVDEDGSAYASGWTVRPFWEMRDGVTGVGDETLPLLWEHTGTTPREMSYLAVQPELGFGVAVLTNTAPGLDQARIDVLAHRLLHMAAGTEAPPAQSDLLVTIAPALLLVLPLLLIAAIAWAGMVRRNPEPSAAALWTTVWVSLAVIAVVLTLCFVVVPLRVRGGLLDTWWWVAAPDLALSMLVMLALTAIALPMVVSLFFLRARRAPTASSSVRPTSRG